ncbi:MAG: hypothetical protein U1F17_01150 [Burkholderiaceae bacterium]
MPGRTSGATLADADFDHPDQFLAELGNGDAMIVEEFDGFLAPLACAPWPVRGRLPARGPRLR